LGRKKSVTRHLISKKRVADHGEVYTGRREVNAMLDLVKRETERIESRFLEPACGRGNFLAEVLARKLRAAAARYKRSQTEYERYAVLAVSSLYGIDILGDNVAACRARLFDIFDRRYSKLFKKKAKAACRNSVRHILSKNIIWGDALTLKTVGDDPRPIVFTEWSPVNANLLNRRDFAFHALLPGTRRQTPLFSENDRPLVSDLGGEVFLPSPVKGYPVAHFLRIADEDAP